MAQRAAGYLKYETLANQKSPDIIFGTRAIAEAISAGRDIDKVFVQKGLKNELFQELRDLGIPINIVPVEKLNRISRANHQGMIAFISPVSFASLDHVISDCYQQAKDPFLLMLDGITDVRNFGAIVRTAEGAGVSAIIVPAKGAAQINADAMKTSAGALNHVPICRSHNLVETLQYLQGNGIEVIAASEKAEQSFYQLEFTRPTGLILGSEEKGISPSLIRKADHLARIPMLGKVSSLNVSVSAAIMMYEVVRQKQMADR